MSKIESHYFHDVTLIDYDEKGELKVALAAKCCTRNARIEQLIKELEAEPNRIAQIIKDVKKSGHLSLFEHVNYTFALEGVSRVLLDQLARHRHISLTVTGQRYVKPDAWFINRLMFNQSDSENKDVKQSFTKAYENSFNAYIDLKEHGVKQDEARYVLPMGSITKVILTTNARELFHIFALRRCTRAQEEFQLVAKEMARLVKEKHPNIFADGFDDASCVQLGYCPEGDRCCGKSKPLEALLDGFDFYKAETVRLNARIEELEHKIDVLREPYGSHAEDEEMM